jgi:hypothetical protein
MDKDTDVATDEVLVVAKYARGVMLAQDGFYLLAFDGAGVNAAIGDIVTVTGKVGEYAGLKQIASPVVEVISSDNEVVLPEPKVLEGLDEYASDKIELIQYSGTLAVSGNYFNVNVDGSTRQGSIQYPLNADALKALDKKPIVATGFFTGITSSKYVNMMSTSVVEQEGNVFDVTPTQINVAASATSTEINVTGNVAWTAEASDGASVNPASGTGAGTITVTFPANEDANNTKDYTVFVRTEAEGVNDEFEVNITQGKAVTGTHFVKVTADADLTDGLYLIVNEKASVALKDAVDEASNGLAVSISGGAVEATAAVKAVAFTFTASNGAFQGANGMYPGPLRLPGIPSIPLPSLPPTRLRSAAETPPSRRVTAISSSTTSLPARSASAITRTRRPTVKSSCTNSPTAATSLRQLPSSPSRFPARRPSSSSATPLTLAAR